MKLKTIVITNIAALVLISASSSWANTVKIDNQTKHNLPFTYQFAYQGKQAKQPIYAQPISTQLHPGTNTISVPDKGSQYYYSGLIPLSVGGHHIPAEHRQFAKMNQCAATTTPINRNINMAFSQDGKSMNCTVYYPRPPNA